MNNRPIEEAKHSDLRGSLPALRRAAQRAREIAASTGTLLVVGSNGRVEYRYPDATRSPVCFVDEPVAAKDSLRNA
jgi:hypothetical protein